MKRFLALLLTLAAFTASGTIIPSARLGDWRLGVTSGVYGGIPAQTQTVFTNFSAGATAAQINAAIQSCPSNQVVKLGAGTYSLSTYLTMKNGVVLRGTIVDSTNASILSPSVNMDNVIVLGADENPITGTLITTNDYAKGVSNITVASTASLAVGDLASISQVIDTNVMWDSDGTTTRPIRQQVEIKAINSLVVTVWPPVHYPLIWGGAPRLDRYTQSFTSRRIGIEDLCIYGNGKTVTWGILMQRSLNCWVKNVHLVLMSNYQVVLYGCLFCEFTENNLDDSPSYASNHAGFLLGNGSGLSATSCAVYNNIMIRVPPGAEVNGGSSGNIVAYNFILDTQLDLVGTPGIYSNHGPEPNFNLYEGNIANGYISDGYFGGSIYDTIHRNWGLGWQESYSNHGRALWLRNDSLYYNVVGNVWGCTNQTFNAKVGDGSDWEGSYIYVFGDDGSSGEVRGYDNRVTNTMILHGNWDAVTKAVEWSTNSDHTLLDSYYLDAKPSWFGSLTWPPFTPSSGYTNLTYAAIPAGYLYLYGSNPPAGGGESPSTGGNAYVSTILIR